MINLSSVSKKYGLGAVIVTALDQVSLHIDEGEFVVVLQPLVAGGQEVIAGMSHDPVFGPLVMLGLGGVQVELIRDVAFSLHPLTDRDPDKMLRQLKTLPMLTGWRGSPPRDVEALKDVLLRFSALIEDTPEIDQIEINPLIVRDRGKGCVAVDARVLVKT